MIKRDCEYCEFYEWDKNHKYQSCSKWECEKEKKNERKTERIKEFGKKR